MKPKNLVSLSVAAAFAVLALTGLLIYFGQGTHVVEHTHAWFGILFVAAAGFHIVNNWSSLMAYSKNRRTGGIQRELVLPVAIAIVFAAGIGFGWPVFDKLANFGKGLFQGERPRQQSMSQTTADSIAGVIEKAYVAAYNRADTAALSAVLPPKSTVLTQAGTTLTGLDVQQNLLKQTAPESLTTSVGKVDIADEQVLIVRGTTTSTAVATPTVYTHVLKEQDKKWRIIAVQNAYPSVQ